MILSIILSSFLACGEKTPVKVAEPVVNSKYPKWFLNQPELCGVGVIPLNDVNGDVGQAKSYAEDKARNDLSKQIETKTGSMIKQYNNATNSMGEAVSETNRQEVSKSLSKLTLNGSIPEKADVIDEQYYSLVCMKPGALTDALNNMKQLNEAQRAAVVKRAEKADKELKDELENYDNY